MKTLRMILKNVGRNKVRSTLTALGTMVLVFVVTLVWSILVFLDDATREKSQNIKAIVTERWQIPSQMPFTYARGLEEGAAREPGDLRPEDSMTWQFYGGSMEKGRRTFESIVFAIAMEPSKLLTMMDDLDSLPPDTRASFAKVVQKLEENRQGIIVGRQRLETINKRVGDRITLYGFNFRDIDLELEIVGTFPEGRYDNSAVINRDYLNAALDAYPSSHGGTAHPLADKSLNLVWLRVPDTQAYTELDAQIEKSPLFSSPAVKCETASSGVATFLEAYRDLIWGMRWLLAPAILVSLSLVIANAISISVRERRTEFAVLKVLGFRPNQILLMVLGEALLIGVCSGVLSAGLTYLLVNNVLGGIKFPIAFFSAFFIPTSALWWGVAIGAATATFGSLVPAWTARTVKVSEVFARVA